MSESAASKFAPSAMRDAHKLSFSDAAVVVALAVADAAVFIVATEVFLPARLNKAQRGLLESIVEKSFVAAVNAMTGLRVVSVARKTVPRESMPAT